MSTLKSFKDRNVEAVYKAVRHATTSTKDCGISAPNIQKKTGLCIRTVQTHLRSLRDDGRAFNHRGLWSTVDLSS
jgi:hypothetical protein